MVKFDEIYCSHYMDNKYILKFNVYIEDDQVIFCRVAIEGDDNIYKYKYSISELMLILSADGIKIAKSVVNRYERDIKINNILK